MDRTAITFYSSEVIFGFAREENESHENSKNIVTEEVIFIRPNELSENPFDRAEEDS